MSDINPRKLWRDDPSDDDATNETARAAAPTGTQAASGQYGTNEQNATSAVPNQRFSMQQLPDVQERKDDDFDDEEIARNRAEFTTVYDIIDSLQEQLEEAKGTVFSPGIVKIDRDTFADQLETLKSKLPVQLERASALMREAEHRLDSAQSQANVMITTAQGRAADMIREAQEQAQIIASQDNITAIARQKARTILDDAQAKSDKLTNGADRYCITMMEELQRQLNKFGRDVQSGLTVLRDRQQEASEDLPHVQQSDYPQN